MLAAPFLDIVGANIGENIALKERLLADRGWQASVAEVGQRFIEALQRGNKIFFLGNGGSAADALHLAAELVGRFEQERRALPALALTENASNVTAIANDYSYEAVFARQIEALGKPGDVAVGISTSGKSPNVLAALRSAKKLGIITVGMTGQSGNAMGALVDYCICVPSSRTARIQEAHILIGHILCEIVERYLGD